MKQRKIDDTHVEVILSKDDLIKHNINRYIRNNDRRSSRPIMMPEAFEQVAIRLIKDDYKDFNFKYANSVELTPDGEVRVILVGAEDQRSKLVNRHPDALVYSLKTEKDQKKDKEGDAMSDVTFINSKKACVAVKESEFDGSEGAVEKLAKYIGQYGNIVDYSVVKTASGSDLIFTLDKDSYEFALENAVNRAGGKSSPSKMATDKTAGFESDHSVAVEIGEMFVNGNKEDARRYCDENGGTEMKHMVYEYLDEAYGKDVSDSFRRSIYASAVDNVLEYVSDKLVTKVASGDISVDEAKSLYTDIVKDVYAGFDDSISDDEADYRFHLMKNVLPREKFVRTEISRYMYEHDSGDLFKDLAEAMLHTAKIKPDFADTIKESVSKLLLDKEVRNNPYVKDLAEQFNIPVPKDVSVLEIYANNEKGIENSDLIEGSKDLVSVVTIEQDESGTCSAVDFDGNSSFVKVLMDRLYEKPMSLDEVKSTISTVIPGCEIKESDGTKTYNFDESGVSEEPEDSFQALMDEAFNDDDEITDSGYSMLDEEEKEKALAHIENVLSKYADVLDLMDTNNDSANTDQNSQNAKVVNKDGKAYTAAVDPMTGQPVADPTGKVTYTAEDGEIQQWSDEDIQNMQNMQNMQNNVVTDPSQVVTTL